LWQGCAACRRQQRHFSTESSPGVLPFQLSRRKQIIVYGDCLTAVQDTAGLLLLICDFMLFIRGPGPGS
jgi:hypothetical protein